MNRSNVETLEPLLHEHWGIRPTRIEALSSGHTNKTYLVEDAARRAVLRVSWPGKSTAQVWREAWVLDGLGATPNLPALPRLRPTLAAQPFVNTPEGRWLHLFEHIDGSPGLPRDAESGAVDAMRTLACLHAALAVLATIPASASGPLAWIEQRYARVAARPAPPLSAGLRECYEPLLRRIGEQLAAARAWMTGSARWLHGDYHAGNLLFVGRTVSGVLDFDDVGQGSHELEAAFALFALSRDTTVEDHFAFDVRLWDAGLSAYAAPGTGDVPRWMSANRDALRDLFCAEQTLIHLEAAQRGLWTPGPGMGFLACLRQLRAGVSSGR
ncbi:phosphotransferase enzyme family protein [Paraburkholderia sp. B3]|uniref:phosphotransferase enzyme family protein n=1 Tax=Paraburkholderia sp. B3 TaxID=3134791 RepID=UPI00398198D7